MVQCCVYKCTRRCIGSSAKKKAGCASVRLLHFPKESRRVKLWLARAADSVLFCRNRRKFLIIIFSSFFFCKDRSSNCKSYLEYNMRVTKYIISQHTTFTVAICTERVNCIQLHEHATEAVTIVKIIQTFNIRFNDRCTLLFHQSVIEYSSFNIDSYSKLKAMILQYQDC